MVGEGQVVIDGLGHADDAHIPILLLGGQPGLVAGIHAVVAAVVEEIADVQLFEDLHHLLLVFGGDFIAAGKDAGAGGMTQGGDILFVLSGQVDDVLLQDALDAADAGINGAEVDFFEPGLDHAAGAVVDHGRGAAALGDDSIAFQHVRYTPFSFLLY